MKQIFLTLMLVFCTMVAVQAQTKIGYVRSQILLDSSPSRIKAIAAINRQTDAATKELDSMEIAITKEYEMLKQQKASMPASTKEYEANRLQYRQDKMEARPKVLEQGLQTKSEELNAVIIELVKKAVRVVAMAQQFNYIVDETTLLYSAGGIDVTKEVLVELLKLDVPAQK